jgi:hypothetical protein
VVSAIHRGEVLAFFDRYRAVFDTLDGDAVADLSMRGEHGLRVLLCIAHGEDLGAMQDAAD